MLDRHEHSIRISKLMSRNPIVALLGPRQCGKSTLARVIAQQRTGETHWFDLEDPEAVARLNDANLALRPLRGLVVIDEVQRRPDLFPLLRVLADRKPLTARFLVLGSASPSLLRQSSETLAGRIAYYSLGGFDLEEVGELKLDRLWLRGSFPRSFLAKNEATSFEWRDQFVRTFLERDVPGFGIGIAPATLHRFFAMLAHWSGQVWNSSEFGRSFGVADTTVRGYLDVLTATFVARTLPPFFENLGKRQVKSPKVYVRDSGILHSLLRLHDRADLDHHPRIGASFEGFAIEQILRRLRVDDRDCYFWATHAGAELDLLVVRGRRRYGFEIKRNSAPTLTPSMRIAMKDLGLHSLDVVHAGTGSYPLATGIRAVPISELLRNLKPLDT